MLQRSSNDEKGETMWQIVLILFFFSSTSHNECFCVGKSVIIPKNSKIHLYYMLCLLYNRYTISSTYFFVGSTKMKKNCLLCRVQNCELDDKDSVLACPINKFLHVLWGKWWMVVLMALEQPHRYGELKKLLPEITEKMLITTLHELDQATYITKEKITWKHLQSTYTITDLGKKALDIGQAMAEMGKLL